MKSLKTGSVLLPRNTSPVCVGRCGRWQLVVGVAYCTYGSARQILRPIPRPIINDECLHRSSATALSLPASTLDTWMFVPPPPLVLPLQPPNFFLTAKSRLHHFKISMIPESNSPSGLGSVLALTVSEHFNIPEPRFPVAGRFTCTGCKKAEQLSIPPSVQVAATGGTSYSAHHACPPSHSQYHTACLLPCPCKIIHILRFLPVSHL